jgi:hypothetical protein
VREPQQGRTRTGCQEQRRGCRALSGRFHTLSSSSRTAEDSHHPRGWNSYESTSAKEFGVKFQQLFRALAVVGLLGMTVSCSHKSTPVSGGGSTPLKKPITGVTRASDSGSPSLSTSITCTLGPDQRSTSPTRRTSRRMQMATSSRSFLSATRLSDETV